VLEYLISGALLRVGADQEREEVGCNGKADHRTETAEATVNKRVGRKASRRAKKKKRTDSVRTEKTVCSMAG
jgi:hypothetical protein